MCEPRRAGPPPTTSPLEPRRATSLNDTALTVTEICVLVGFTSLGSFSSRFTELVGETPTAYRDRWAARGGAHVPGCFLFMRGALDLGGTAQSRRSAR